MDKFTADQARSISEKVIRREKESYVKSYLEGIYTDIESVSNKGKTETVVCTPIYYDEIRQILIDDGYTVSRTNYNRTPEPVDYMTIRW